MSLDLVKTKKSGQKKLPWIRREAIPVRRILKLQSDQWYTVASNPKYRILKLQSDQ